MDRQRHSIKSKFFKLILQLRITNTECKLIHLTLSDSICLMSMVAHDLSVKNADNTSDCDCK